MSREGAVYKEIPYMDDKATIETVQSSAETSSHERYIGIMTHIIAIPLVLFVVWQAQPGSSLFSWHPTLMILGFGFFMLEAILMFSKSSSIVPTAARATKTKYHWILQVLTVLCAIGGFLIIAINKNMYNKPHFKSWHGFLGGLTVLFTLIQSLMGVTLLYPNLPGFNQIKLAMRKKLHALSGSLIFLMSCVVLLLGFYTNWFTKILALYSWGWILCAICPILLAATVNNQVTQEYLLKKE